MKREELRQWFVEWLDDYYDELYSEDDLTPEVAESVLTALRPVSREQGYDCRRTAQYCGNTGDAADVTGLPGDHEAAKRLTDAGVKLRNFLN